MTEPFEDNIDTVIFATGYVYGFPFLDKSVIDVKENKVELYKYMFSPDLEKLTLAVIGCIQPIGAVMPISGMQSRLATRVFKGLINIPSREEMWHDIRVTQALMEHRYVKSLRHTIQVVFIPFMDELAALVGCKPNFWKMWLTDLRLAWNCIFGPASPYQWRLQGPGKWEGAKDAIYTQWDRTYYPLKTRPLNHKPVESKAKVYILSAMVAIGLGLFVGCVVNKWQNI
ncbi:hypothetical protein CHS0354_004710 [Potamilus streckersoni]|uniref:Flavin-containing monooxygenase n=1 Tax=Potamilus streckersoni TaxID=2493646 RepID=A0AAE0T2I0_9BIVA|nr:hypothetical protein CHS0354_004710 [Potamilus streckersoni]